jgi:hypothetical protein
VRTSRYRLLCLEMLQHHFAALNKAQHAQVESVLGDSAITYALRAHLPARSGVDVATHSAFAPGLPMLGL